MTTERKPGWLRSAAALTLSAITLLPLLAVKPASADHWDWSGRRDRRDSWARDYNRDYRHDRRARRHMRRRMRRIFRNGQYQYIPYGTTYVQPYGTYYTPGGYWVR